MPGRYTRAALLRSENSRLKAEGKASAMAFRQEVSQQSEEQECRELRLWDRKGAQSRPEATSLEDHLKQFNSNCSGVLRKNQVF